MASRVLREAITVLFTLVMVTLQLFLSFHMMSIMKEACIEVVAEKLMSALNSSITLAVTLNCSVIFPLNISHVNVHVMLNGTRVHLTVENLAMYMSIRYRCRKTFEMFIGKIYIISHVSGDVFEVQIWET